MSTSGKRLREARQRHFKSAREAAKALGIPPATYGAHERAEAPESRGRGFGWDEAEVYGRKFEVSPLWLLHGPELELEAQDSTALLGRLDRLASAVERNTAALEKILQSGQAQTLRARIAGVVDLAEERGRRNLQPTAGAEATQGPAMAEILASIRRIIAEDDATGKFEKRDREGPAAILEKLRWLAEDPTMLELAKFLARENLDRAVWCLAGGEGPKFQAGIRAACVQIAGGKPIENIIGEVELTIADGGGKGRAAS